MIDNQWAIVFKSGRPLLKPSNHNFLSHQTVAMQLDVMFPATQIPFIQCHVCTSPVEWPPPIRRTRSPPPSAVPEASVHRDRTQ